MEFKSNNLDVMAFSFVSLSYTYTILQTSIQEIFEEAINSVNENPNTEEVAELNALIEETLAQSDSAVEFNTFNPVDLRTLPEEKSKEELVQEIAASVVQTEILKSDKTENSKTDQLNADLLKQTVLAKSSSQAVAETAIASSVAKSQKIIEYLEEKTLTVNFLKYNYDFSYQPGRLQLGNSRAILDKKDRNISANKNTKSLSQEEKINQQKEAEKRLKESENRKERENLTLLNEMNKRVRLAEENRQKLRTAEKSLQ